MDYFNQSDKPPYPQESISPTFKGEYFVYEVLILPILYLRLIINGSNSLFGTLILNKQLYSNGGYFGH